ncbi:MAG: hypothetical protein J6Y20_03680 [Lachnospiraceae bacterium]|nr:hypothetical protein [Lachnospiraceae bacterium]
MPKSKVWKRQEELEKERQAEEQARQAEEARARKREAKAPKQEQPKEEKRSQLYGTPKTENPNQPSTVDRRVKSGGTQPGGNPYTPVDALVESATPRPKPYLEKNPQTTPQPEEKQPVVKPLSYSSFAGTADQIRGYTDGGDGNKPEEKKEEQPKQPEQPQPTSPYTGFMGEEDEDEGGVEEQPAQDYFPGTEMPMPEKTEAQKQQEQKEQLKQEREALAEQYNDLKYRFMNGKIWAGEGDPPEPGIWYTPEEAQQFETMEGQLRDYDEKIAALQADVNAGEALGTNIMAGLESAGYGLTQALDWLGGENSLPWAMATEVGTLFGVDLTGKNPVTKLKEKGAEEVEYWKQRGAEATEGNDTWEAVGQHAQSISQSAPFIILNLMTMGGAGGAAASPEGLEYISSLFNSSGMQGVSTMAAQGVKALASNPSAQYSFATTFGNSYDEALKDGATPAEATVYAVLNGTYNAMIEVGGADEALGGMQALPAEVQKAIANGDKNFVINYAKSILGEVNEEEWQGFLERGLKSIYQDVALYSDEDPNAIINPQVILDTAKNTAIDTSIMSGGQMAAQYGLNALANAGQKQTQEQAQAPEVEALVQAATPQAPGIKPGMEVWQESDTGTGGGPSVAEILAQQAQGQTPATPIKQAPGMEVRPETDTGTGGPMPSNPLADTVIEAQDAAEAPEGAPVPPTAPEASTEPANEFNNGLQNEQADDTLETAIQLSKMNARPSEVYEASGGKYFMLANGNIVDAKNGDVVYDRAQDKQGSATEPTDVSEEEGTVGQEIPADDRQGVYPARPEPGERVGYEALSDEQAGEITQIVNDAISGANAEELGALASEYGSVADLAKDLYDAYVEGDVVLEQWGEIFPDINGIKEAFDAVTQQDNDQQNGNGNPPAPPSGGSEETAINNLTPPADAGEELAPTTNEEVGPPISPTENGETALAEPGQPKMKRSQTESNTLSSVAEKLGGEQEELYYVPISEQQTITEAVNRVKADMNGEMQSLMGKDMWTAADIDTGMTIYGILKADAVRTGDNTAANAWAKIVQTRGTKSGQALQAFSKWTRSAAGQASYAADVIEQSDNLSQEEKSRITNDLYGFAAEMDSVEDGDTTAIRDVILKLNNYRGTGTFIKGNFEKMLNEVEDFDWLREYAQRQLMSVASDATNDASLGQKIKTWQVNAQLSRLGTFFRNIGGNLLFGAQDTLTQDGLGVALDWLASKATGKRTVGLDKSWFSAKARNGAHDALIRSVLEVAGDVSMNGEGSKYGTTSNRTFKMNGNGFERFMSRWEQLLGYSLTTSDRTSRGSIETAIDESLDSFDLTDEERAALAEGTADYRLFQNRGTAYKMSKGLHDLLNYIGIGGTVNGPLRQGGFGLGDTVNPYPGVPANLAVKALEYSPANIIKGGVEFVKVLQSMNDGSFDVTKQNQAVMDVARGIAGVPIIALLATAFRTGIIRNSDDEEDKDAKAQNRAEGKTGVQINLDAFMRALNGDSADWRSEDDLLSIGWLEPMNAFMAIASMVAEEDEATLGTYSKDLFSGSLQGVLEMPVMGNIKNVYDTFQYSAAESSGEKIGEAAIGLAGDALTGMMPAPVGQAAKTGDLYFRDTSADTAAQRVINNLLSNIPGLRETLPEQTDVFGNPREYSDSAVQRFLNNFVLPGAINELNQTETSAAVEALYEATGDAGVYPDRKAPTSFAYGGERVKLTSDEKRAYHQTYADFCEENISHLLTSGDYDDMSDAEKAEMIGTIKEYANYFAKRDMMESRGESYSSKTMDKTAALVDSGIDLVGYLTGKQKADTDGSGGLKQEEVYDWLIDSNYSDEQKALIWATTTNGKRDWEQYLESVK